MSTEPELRPISPRAAWADGFTYRSLDAHLYCGAVERGGRVHWEVAAAPEKGGTLVAQSGTWHLPSREPTRVLRWRGGAP